MARLARMMGLGGAAALGLGMFLTVPAYAATTPPATLTVPPFGLTCTNGDANHQLVLQIKLSSTVEVETTVSNVAVSVNNAAVTPVNFSPNPIPANQDTSSVALLVTPGQINSVTATATITSVGGEPVNLTLQSPPTQAACNSGATTSTTAGGSTTSTTGGSTTSTTGGSTTSTTGGSTTSTSTGATTTSTSTTLGPNDTTGNLTLSPSSVTPGQSVSFAGTGFAPNADVTLNLFSNPVALGTVKSNAAGAIAGTVTIPSTTPTGSHHIEAKGPNAAGNGVNLLKGNLEVKAASSTIPRTGGSTDYLLPMGIAVVAFGILAFAWRERRLSLR
jgi:hypothetical protein